MVWSSSYKNIGKRPQLILNEEKLQVKMKISNKPTKKFHILWMSFVSFFYSVGNINVSRIYLYTSFISILPQ